jgi:hypothetical protein
MCLVLVVYMHGPRRNHRCLLLGLVGVIIQFRRHCLNTVYFLLITEHTESYAGYGEFEQEERKNGAKVGVDSRPCPRFSLLMRINQT